MTSEPIWWCESHDSEGCDYEPSLHCIEYHNRYGECRMVQRFFADSAPDEELVRVLVERGVLRLDPHYRSTYEPEWRRYVTEWAKIGEPVK